MKKILKRTLLALVVLIVLYSPVMIYNFATFNTKAREGWIKRSLQNLHQQQMDIKKKTGKFSSDVRDFNLEDLTGTSLDYFGFSEKCVTDKNKMIYSFDLPDSHAEWNYDYDREKPIKIDDVPDAREKIAKILSDNVDCKSDDYTITWMHHRPERPHLTGIYRIDGSGQVRVIRTLVPTFWQQFFPE